MARLGVLVQAPTWLPNKGVSCRHPGILEGGADATAPPSSDDDSSPPLSVSDTGLPGRPDRLKILSVERILATTMTDSSFGQTSKVGARDAA